MGRPYGKSALTADLTLTGFDKYLEKVEAAGKSIDGACVEAVNAALPIVERSMKAGAERHWKTGNVVRAIETQPAKAQRNFIYGSVGIDWQKHPEAKEGVYQEYGDGHSPGFPDSFVRPAVDENRKKIAAAERAVLRSKGVPVK